MIKKDYHNKNVENPFLKGRKDSAKGILASKFRISIFLLFLAGVGWLCFLIFSPYFELQNVNYKDTEKNLQSKIEIILKAYFAKPKLFIFSRRNFFLFKESDVVKELTSIFLLNGLEIKKQFPATLVIQAKEKNDVLLLVAKDKPFLIDMNGIVVDNVPINIVKTQDNDNSAESSTSTPKTIDLSLLSDFKTKMPILVVEEPDKNFDVRDKVLEKEFVELILRMHDTISERFGTSVDVIKIKKMSRPDIIVSADGGWEAYFSKDGNMETQLENLGIVLKEKIGDKISLLEYVDLRLDDKLFYKIK